MKKCPLLFAICLALCLPLLACDNSESSNEPVRVPAIIAGTKTYDAADGGALVFTCDSYCNVKNVSIAEQSVAFTQEDVCITIEGTALPRLESGKIWVRITFEGNVSKMCSFTYNAVPVDLAIVGPVGVAYPYIDAAKQYLMKKNASISDYGGYTWDAAAPILIEWKCEDANADSFKVEYATKADYSNAVTVMADKDTRSVEVYNLYIATEYYVRISSYNAEEKLLHTADGSFETTDIGPRVMYIDHICNVRDMGGYVTSDGKVIAQGMIYRSGTLTTGDKSIYLTSAGQEYMSKDLGIKTEIDFRSEAEVGLSESLIPGAKLVYIPVVGYSSAFSDPEPYRKVFSIFADKNNYPIVFHCLGGADRTGTVAFLLNALLGVSEDKLIKDYEFTSFSFFGIGDVRSASGGTYGQLFQPFRKTLNTYKGETLQEKVESYLLSIGVTAKEIANIKAIMCAE